MVGGKTMVMTLPLAITKQDMTARLPERNNSIPLITAQNYDNTEEFNKLSSDVQPVITPIKYTVAACCRVNLIGRSAEEVHHGEWVPHLWVTGATTCIY